MFQARLPARHAALDDIQAGLPYGYHLLHRFVVRQIRVAVGVDRHGPLFQILLSRVTQVLGLFADIFGYFALQARLELGPAALRQRFHFGIAEQMRIPYRVLHIKRVCRGRGFAVSEVERSVIEIPYRSRYEFPAAVLVDIHAARVPYLVVDADLVYEPVIDERQRLDIFFIPLRRIRKLIARDRPFEIADIIVDVVVLRLGEIVFVGRLDDVDAVLTACHQRFPLIRRGVVVKIHLDQISARNVGILGLHLVYGHAVLVDDRCKPTRRTLRAAPIPTK